jgi:small subunit ribosomal protein S1
LSRIAPSSKREREEAEKKLWENLAVGQTFEGTVRKLMPFGAFVDIGGADGLIHISQLAWDRVNHPSEVLSEGQRVTVKVEKFDPQTKKIGLSYRDMVDNPWNDVEAKYPTGAIVDGTITRLMDFGVFVKLEPGIEGLVHISELAHHRVVRPSHVVSEGQAVEVKVLTVDAAAQRIALSIKQTGADPKAIAAAQQQAEAEAEAEAAANRGPAVKPKHKKLKGGLGKGSGGESVGLNW